MAISRKTIFKAVASSISKLTKANLFPTLETLRKASSKEKENLLKLMEVNTKETSKMDYIMEKEN